MSQLELDGLMTPDGFRHHTRKLFKRGGYGNHKYNLNHAQMGISGEIGELAECLSSHVHNGDPLDRDNAIEELGDILFYIDALVDDLGTDEGLRQFNVLENYNRTGEGFLFHLTKVTIYGGEVTDMIKKYIIYSKGGVPVGQLMESLTILYAHLSAIVFLIGSSWDEIRTANYNKLKVRYPQGYSDKAAQERIDKS